MSGNDVLGFVEQHSTAIIVGIVALLLLRGILFGSARDDWRGERARRQAVAASLGFRTPGGESHHAGFGTGLARIMDGTERLGPFPRVSPMERVVVEFEGERDGMTITIVTHTRDSETDPPERSTLACFVTPEIQVSAFELYPGRSVQATPEPEPAAPATGGIGKMLGAVGRFFSTTPGVQFPGRAFTEIYTLQSTFAVTIRDDFDSRVLDFFEKNPGWTVQGLRGRLLIWRENVLEPHGRIPDFVSEAAAVAQVFRRPVRSDG